MMKNLFTLIIALITITAFAQKGTVQGKVLDKEADNMPLPFANVFIKNSQTGTTTDMDGAFVFQADPGTYTVVFSFVGYETIEVPNIVVKAGEVTTLDDLTMGADQGVALKEVVVKASSSKESESALLTQQKKAVEIKTSIGAQELSKKGISNVEQAVTKTTGITKVASRGVFVRGLDERYNYLTVNGLPISPSNWENKIPSLSQFSSSILRSVDVNKVFYPNLYGDFAGASMNVNTKDRPTKQTTKVSISAGVNFQSLSNDFLVDREEDKLHYMGYGGKDARKGPKEISNDNYNSTTLYSSSGQKAVDDFGSDWDTEEVNLPLSLGLGVENGGLISSTDDRKIAYHLGLNYSNSYNSQIGSSVLRNPQGNLLRNNSKRNSFNFSTTNNFLVGIFSKSEKSELNFNYFFLKNTDNEVGDNFGRSTEIAANALGRESIYSQSYLSQFQFLGNHDIGNNKLGYGLTYGDSNYAQPDNNIITLEEISTNNYIFSTNSGKMYKYFLDSENNNLAANVYYDLNFSANNSEEEKLNKLTIGADYNTENLDIYNRFITTNLNVGNIDVDPDNIDASLNSALLNNIASYRELPETPYTGIKTDIYAGYVSYSHNFSDKFNASVGARLENFERTVGAGTANDFEFSKFFVLPSLNMKYSLSEKMNLRLAASNTYTKPKNIEIVDVTRQNSVGELIKGNPNLENSDNYSLDLKWEFFPDRGSVYSLNVFGKYINKPIERLVQDNESFIQTVFQNTDNATLYGAEIEVKSNLGSILQKENLENLSFGAKTTLMQSKVSISEDLRNNLNLTNESRRLQGASDFLINADVTYKFNFTEESKSYFTVLFDTFSKRISAVGSGAATNKYDDEYENPFKNLSITWKNEFNEKLGLTLKVNNILNDTYSRELNTTLDGSVVGSREYKIGTSASLSLSYKF